MFSFLTKWKWLQRLRAGSAPAASPLQAAALAPSMAEVGPRALALILEFEGLDQPWARPPGESGITIGVGFDLGYCTLLEFAKAWSQHLPAKDFSRLRAVIGKKGAAAEAVERSLRDCRPITRAAAMEVLHRCTLPKWQALTAQTFPGLHVLSPDQQGVLVSLAFNRGTGLSGERRREMRLIRDVLLQPGSPQHKAHLIAGHLLAMQRLWPTVPGLQRRRRAEAALMESMPALLAAN